MNFGSCAKGLTTVQSSLLFLRRFESTGKRQYDVVVVGGGIVGCAAARELLIRQPKFKVAIVEKEDKLAAHQSGNNSGVIHAGIYYAPGTLKAKLCVRGLDLAYKYCDQFKVPYKKVGKLIVAVEPEEIPRLEELYKRGLQNGVKDMKMIDGSKIKEIEPNCVGLKAIHSPHTGIVDWGEVTRSFGNQFKLHGGDIHLGHTVAGFNLVGGDFPLRISFNGQPDVHCRYAITCAGLHSDRVAVLSGCSSVPKIVPFRGEYLLLKPEKRNLVRGNIYPVPDPRFPFLGVHFTPRVNGDVWLGPNAVLAYKREGYHYSDVNVKDLYDALSFSGMQRLAIKFMGFGLKELYRGIFIAAQVKQLQRFVPTLSPKDVTRGPAGVRAQALDDKGNLVDDFVFDSGKGDLASRLLHVRNAPSPAATSSLAIAEMVVDEAEKKFHL